MKKVRTSLITTVSILCLFFCVSAVGTSTAYANSVITKIQDTYKKIDSFHANFTQELYHRESEYTQKTSGTFSYEKAPLIRWETNTPQKEILIVNKEAIWNYIPKEEIVYKYSPKLLDDSSNIIAVLTGGVPLNRDFDVELMPDVREGAVTLKHLKLYPHQPTMDLTEAAIWVDSRTNYILAAKITDFYNNYNYVKFSNFKINVKFNPTSFAFTPPKGVDVETVSETPDFKSKELSR